MKILEIYSCWRFDTAEEKLGLIEDEADLTVKAVHEVLDAKT